MTGHKCCVCGNTRTKDSSVSFHRFPKEQKRRSLWLSVFELNEDDIKASTTRVCSRHFPEGDSQKPPSASLGKRYVLIQGQRREGRGGRAYVILLDDKNLKRCSFFLLGKRFASPIKHGPRAKRARGRDEQRQLDFSRISATPSSSRSATPAAQLVTHNPTPRLQLHIAEAGEQLETDYGVHELPCADNPPQQDSAGIVVSRALLSRIEVLEAENNLLRSQSREKHYFRLEDIQHDDKLVSFYTGFVSFMVLAVFFDFLGPVVNHLNYWGEKEKVLQRHRKRKLDPLNQLFLTLVKLKLNLKHTDLAFRFGLSASQTSRYLTTWICFLYNHLKEINWMPAVDQVVGTLPAAFREKYPTTYAIIDGSEVFIETPSDLHLQSSTWSQYKHHNTVKFLVACTPNGAICFISPVYVGSISDKQLTQKSGFLDALKDKPGISIMADRGFTIKDILQELGIDLNIPPFLEGRRQLPATEIEAGRRIASLRIHVERAIGRLKTFRILQATIPISMARLTNQIVHVCAFLTTFIQR